MADQQTPLPPAPQAPVPQAQAPQLPAAAPERLPELDYPVSGGISSRSLSGIFAAIAGGIAGWFGAETYTRVKMYEFDGEVSKLVKNDIMNRKTGVGAAMDSAGATIEHVSGPMGNFAPGASSHSLRLAHEFELAQSGRYPFARFIQRFGRAPVVLATTVAGAAVAFLGYKAFTPKGEKKIDYVPVPIVPAAPELPPSSEAPAVQELASTPRTPLAQAVIDTSKPQNWAAKVEATPEAQRAQGA